MGRTLSIAFENLYCLCDGEQFSAPSARRAKHSAISKVLGVPERNIRARVLLSRGHGGIGAIGRFFHTAQTQVAGLQSPVQAPQHSEL